MSTNAEIALKKWLSEDVLRRADIKNHTHGIRVTLTNSYRELVSAVENSLSDAILVALKHYEEFGHKRELEDGAAYAESRYKEALSKAEEAKRIFNERKLELDNYLAQKLLNT